MHLKKLLTSFVITVISIFVFLTAQQGKVVAQTKAKTSKTRKRVVSQKPFAKIEASKPKEPQASKAKENDYDLGVTFQVDQGRFLFAPYKFASVVITNRDKRPVTIKKIMANGELQLEIGLGFNDNPDKAKFPKVLTIGDKITVIPSTDYNKELIFIDILTDLGVQSYKARQK